MERIAEIQARLAAIKAEIETAEGDALTALETESRALLEELTALQTKKADEAAREQARANVAAGAGVSVPMTPKASAVSLEERAAKEFVDTHRMTVGLEQARSVLISSGTLASPTEVQTSINDIPGAKYSSIIDMIKVTNCSGMTTYRVPYVVTDADAASEQTEGSAVNAQTLGTYNFVDIQPTSVECFDYISKQVRKQTPVLYASKVREQALISLRKKAAALVTAKLKASTLVDTLNASVASGKGVITETTLRDLALAYGGDESVVGGAVLFLNKTDLLAFGKVRGTNEKKPIYKITPDAQNPNTGTIEDDGLVVRYCLNKNLTACAGTAQSSSGATKTMFYGSPRCLELGLFSDYEIAVSEDFAFTSLMDTIRGDVELGADVVVKNGFVALTIAKS